MLQWLRPAEIRAEKAAKSLLLAAGALGLAAAAAVVFFIGVESWPAWREQGAGLILGGEWSVGEGRFGALPMLAGSAVVTSVAFAAALPIGLSAAILTAEFLPARSRPLARFLLEALAGVPSVVYGLMGIAVLVPWLQRGLGLLTGRTLLTGGLVLGVMILPTLAAVAEDALRAVAREKREAGWALGLNRIETLLHCVLPEARAGIAAAGLLSLGRALGETIAVMLLVGSLDRLPNPWYDWLVPGQTLTSKLGREAVEAAVGSPQYHALAALALILLVVVAGLTLLGQRLSRVEGAAR